MAAAVIPPGCTVYQKQIEETCLDRVKMFAEILNNKSDVGSILSELRSLKSTVGQDHNPNLSHQFKMSMLNILTDLKENNSYEDLFNDVFGINKAFLPLFIAASIIVSLLAFVCFTYGVWGTFGYCRKKFSDYRKLSKQKKLDYKRWEVENQKKRSSIVKEHQSALLGSNSGKSRRFEKTKEKGEYVSQERFLMEKLAEADSNNAILQEEVNQLKANQPLSPPINAETVDV